MRWVRIILWVGMLGISLCVRAADVLVLRSEASAPYQQTSKALAQALAREREPSPELEVVDLALWERRPPATAYGAARVVVAVGQKACQAAVERNHGLPLLCTLIPRTTFLAVLNTSSRKASSQLSAVYLSQPLSRQLALLRMALPKAQRIGVLWGPESAPMVESLRELAQGAGLQMVDAQVQPDPGSLFPALRRVLESADVLLALPDPRVYNAQTLQNILLACFRAGVPMQSFAANYVQAGALLALYVTPEQEGLRAAALVKDVLSGRGLPPEPVYVDDFEVGVNAHVAHSLGLSLDADRLRQRLRQREGLQ